MGCQQVKQSSFAQEDYVSEASTEGVIGECTQWPRKLFDEEPGQKLVGVVVTICEGESYDPLFQEVRPTTVPGERVSTYQLRCCDVVRLHEALTGRGGKLQGSWRQLAEDVRSVAADSVVFNWECCSGCGDFPFPSQCGRQCGQKHRLWGPPPQKSETMPFMGFAVRSGYTCMCSDFSLKSLIHEWSEEELGPNPFVKVGECDQAFCLEFAPAELKSNEVPQQLQVVGELCAENGKANVKAMGGTIVYTVNPTRVPTSRYELQVLTVVTEHSHLEYTDPEWAEGSGSCSVGEGASKKTGTAGHVSLTYGGKGGKGGQLITSNGHWIELTRINTDFDAVMRVAAHNFGQDEVDSFQEEFRVLDTDGARSECVQKRANKMVSQSMATRMKCRTKF